MFHGFTVGIPSPPAFLIAFVAATMTLLSVPSPVKAAMPDAAQAENENIVVGNIIQAVSVMQLHGAYRTGKKRILKRSAKQFQCRITWTVFDQRVHLDTDFFPFVIVADGGIVRMPLAPGPASGFYRLCRYIPSTPYSKIRYGLSPVRYTLYNS